MLNGEKGRLLGVLCGIPMLFMAEDRVVGAYVMQWKDRPVAGSAGSGGSPLLVSKYMTPQSTLNTESLTVKMQLKMLCILYELNQHTWGSGMHHSSQDSCQRHCAVHAMTGP